MMLLNTLSSFEYFKQKRDLALGAYKIIEHDETESVVILSDFCQEEWMSVQDYEDREVARIEDLYWANDGLDLLYPED